MANEKEDPKERKAFMKAARRILEERREALSSSISSSFDDMREADIADLTASDEDDMGSSGDVDTAYRLLELESVEVEEIDHALRRMDEGTYGVCEECDKNIGVERLKALPFTSMCIGCKRLHESNYENEYY